MIAYKTSKDYKHLIELLDKGIEVVCFYTYIWNECDKDRPGYEKIMVTDVCTAKILNKGEQYEQYVISCRGTGFLNYWTKDMPYSYTFEELLKARDIEYIEPDSIINNSLQEEPVSEELEEEIVDRWKTIHNAGNKIPFDTFNGIAKHFFELGMAVSNKAQKGE